MNGSRQSAGSTCSTASSPPSPASPRASPRSRSTSAPPSPRGTGCAGARCAPSWRERGRKKRVEDGRGRQRTARGSLPPPHFVTAGNDTVRRPAMPAVGWVRMATYEQLRAWQECHKLVLETYRATKSFPTEELYGLMAHSLGVDLPAAANIVEGSSKHGA